MYLIVPDFNMYMLLCLNLCFQVHDDVVAVRFQHTPHAKGYAKLHIDSIGMFMYPTFRRCCQEIEYSVYLMQYVCRYLMIRKFVYLSFYQILCRLQFRRFAKPGGKSIGMYCMFNIGC